MPSQPCRCGAHPDTISTAFPICCSNFSLPTPVFSELFFYFADASWPPECASPSPKNLKLMGNFRFVTARHAQTSRQPKIHKKVRNKQVQVRYLGCFQPYEAPQKQVAKQLQHDFWGPVRFCCKFMMYGKRAGRLDRFKSRARPV